MEDIGQHISELLFDHDCVIVPSLGGFLASNQPSRILFPNNIIYPPYRRIAFNVYLKQNDGLLANHIVETENVLYSEATQRIDSYTAGCFEMLDSGRKVNITRVGTLFYDKEKNILFEPFRNINHLKDSFGLEAVHLLPVQKEEETEKVKTQPEKKLRPSIPPPINISKKNKIGKSGRYIGIAVIISAIAWFSLNLYFLAPKNYESTSLNPFDSQQIVINQSDSIRNLPDTENKKNNNQPAETASVIPADTLAVVEENNVRDTSKVSLDRLGISEKSNKTKSKPEETLPEDGKTISSLTNNHYVIAGVFRIKENAQSMLLQLRQLGFNNARITYANKFNYVSYDMFSNHEEAWSMTDSLRNKKMEGWIWKH